MTEPSLKKTCRRSCLCPDWSLPLDLTHEILNLFLSPLEALLSRGVCQAWGKQVQVSDQVARVRAALEVRKPGLTQWLRESKSACVGSAVLQACTGDDWCPGDVDIIQQVQSICPPFTGFFEHQIEYIYQSNIPNIRNVTRYGLNRDLDVHILGPDISFQQWVSLFDLEFVRLLYDGVSLTVYHPQSILTRSSPLHFECLELDSETGLFEYPKTTGRRIPRLQERIRKYEARGFQIGPGFHSCRTPKTHHPLYWKLCHCRERRLLS